MPLILNVISYKGGAPLHTISARFAEAGGVIGRSTDNQFVLPDPDKFVSRKHAIIKYDQGVYSITDTSAGGTSVTSRNILLQHDTFQLADGDRLKIGEYEIQVSLSPVDDLSASSVPIFPAIPEPIMAWREAVAPAAMDPFGLGEVYPKASTPAPESYQPASFIDQPDVASIHQSLPPIEVVPQDAPEIDVDALLRDLEAPSGLGAANELPGEEEWDFPMDAFDAEAQGHAPHVAPTAVDSVRVEPADMSDLPASEVIPQVVGAALPATSVSAAETPVYAAAVPHASVAEAKTEATIDQPHPSPVASMETAATTPAARGAEATAAQTLPPVATPVPTSPSPVAPAVEQAELFKMFLAGAGIQDAGFAAEEELPELMRTLGVLFRDLVDGMMTVLRARAELKSQFRVSMTTIRPVNNNPLKFTANVEDAMKILLSAKHPGFVDPMTAVREGLSDLMNHQLSMPAGIQASLSELLRRFDPQRYEQQYQEGIVFQKKAKCWDAYSKAYPSLVNDAWENFFGEEFAAAYEQQERILRGHGPGNKA